MGFADAAHAETDPNASRLFTTPLSCSLVGKTMEVAISPELKTLFVPQARSVRGRPHPLILEFCRTAADILLI